MCVRGVFSCAVVGGVCFCVIALGSFRGDWTTRGGSVNMGACCGGVLLCGVVVGAFYGV